MIPEIAASKLRCNIKVQVFTHHQESGIFKKLFYKTEKSLTRVSIYIVWIFLATHFWKMIPNIYEAWHWGDTGQIWPKWLDYVALMSHLAIVINSTLNFLVYLLL